MSKKIVCSSPDCKHGCIRKVVYGDKVLCWDCYQDIPSSIRSPAVKLREETMMNENMVMKNDYEIRGDITDLDDARKASETARARFMPYSQEAMIRKRRRGDGKLNNL